MYKKVTLATAIIALSASALAETYQFEGEAVVARVDDSGLDAKMFGLGATYHFNAVDTEGKPYYEAGFLQRSSNIYADYIDTDLDGADMSDTNIGGEFYAGGIGYLSAEYIRMEVDIDGIGSADGSFWSLTGGITILDGLLVTTTYVEDIGYDINLDAKYVTAVGNGQFVTVRGGFVDGEDDTTISAGADYYFNQATSVGIDVANTDDDTMFGINARHFFTPMVFAGVSYASGDDYDTFAIEGGFRF